MKPIHYVKKYSLDLGSDFNHKEFISDLTLDFISLLEVGKSHENIKGFENAVRAIRMKFDGIGNKTAGVFPEKLWNYFFATVIAKMREDLFPDIMKARADRKEEIKIEREERKRMYDGGDFFEDWIKRAFIASILTRSPTPTAELAVLGLTESATETDVKEAFKTLAMRHHPDKGGKQSKFVEATEAKNKCLVWLAKKK
jgi:hypothetical protein